MIGLSVIFQALHFKYFRSHDIVIDGSYRDRIFYGWRISDYTIVWIFSRWSWITIPKGITISGRNQHRDTFCTCPFDSINDIWTCIDRGTSRRSQTHIDGICTKGNSIINCFYIKGRTSRFLTIGEDTHKHHLCFRSYTIDLFAVCCIFIRVPCCNPCNVHPMRFSLSFLDIICTVKVIVSVDYLVVVPFTIINSCLLLSSFNIILVFKLSFWRICDTKNFVVDIQTWVNDSNHHSFTLVSLFPSLWDSNDFIALNTLRFFCSLMTGSRFRTCRSRYFCSFFYRFCSFCWFCLWSICSFFRCSRLFSCSSLCRSRFCLLSYSLFSNCCLFNSSYTCRCCCLQILFLRW